MTLITGFAPIASEIFGTFGGGGTYAFAQNPLNYKGAEHGLSGLDFPNTWTVSFNETLPFFRAQHGIIGHMFGGWSMAGSYILQSGQAYTPEQVFASSSTSYNTLDNSFNGTFNGGYETARPFVSNLAAPAGAVGLYEGDDCPLFYPNINDPHHLYCDATGTPYGNAGRNTLRDARTNSAKFQIAKTVNWGERARIIWHMSMVNAFNHPQLCEHRSVCGRCRV